MVDSRDDDDNDEEGRVCPRDSNEELARYVDS